MVSPSHAKRLEPGAGRDANQTLERFEEVWRTGTPPRIADFMPRGGDRQLLEDLIKIDLEYRWKTGRLTSSGPRLEEYAKQHPELGEFSAELIGEEYRVRRCWGDSPGHTEYFARFPRQQAA